MNVDGIFPFNFDTAPAKKSTSSANDKDYESEMLFYLSENQGKGGKKIF